MMKTNYISKNQNEKIPPPEEVNPKCTNATL